MNSRFFVRNREKWEAVASASHLLDGEAKCRVHQNAILLPLRKIEDKTKDGVYEGGVCDSEFAFLAGRRRSLGKEGVNFDCLTSYRVDASKIQNRHERVVFGGIIVNHLGHTLLDASCRLWYLVDNSDFEKVVFLEYPREFVSSFDGLKFVELLGIPREKVEIISVPTMFSEVIVPEETMYPLSGYKKEFMMPFEAICKRIAPGGVEKLYLTRRRYEMSGIVNEEFFESFFEARGFTVVSPEKLSIEEQISLVSGAREIVSTIGTMTHLILFARKDATVTILNRTTCIAVQMLIDEACGLAPYYVDATSNPLPVRHVHGPFLMLPNRYFREYLDHRFIGYSCSELDLADEMPRLTYLFLQKWAETYRTPSASSAIGDETLYEVIKSLNDALYDDVFDPSSYEGAKKLQVSLNRERENSRKAKKELRALRSSKSWKLTAPLRAITEWISER